ncbi:CCGSCS motif protein [Hydrocarboniclastica marina]|uniref:CCGSCS motif protein n=2 Tax=Hydrocarboniclastica marina TaxID=2259620 RepID=A0A4P7XHR7_9ALTE|nr:CCGSCS motif protein [Hydrocarboniclastica marina]
MLKPQRGNRMALPTDTAKKETAETEATLAQASANAEVKQTEAQEKKKGKHGEDFCCGSCS